MDVSNFFYIEHNFINLINNLYKFQISIITLSKVISNSISHFTLKSYKQFLEGYE